MRSGYRCTLAICLLLGSISLSRSQLAIQDPTIVGSRAGYIDKATVVVEPHGGYVEESLYLEYGDHGQFPNNKNLEIAHRFTLPACSAVNDLWLWVGDTVMKARVIDVWTARHIYDSIVVRRRDPAFLSKAGERYELHIYPLESGKQRKIKMNFIAPTRWVGRQATAESPLVLLKGSAATLKPLEVLFRVKEDLWGTPAIPELPQLIWQPVFDSAGYRYCRTVVSDVSTLGSLSLSFSPAFANGLFAPASDRKGDSSYFQCGVDPVGMNVFRSDTVSRSVLVGVDLSGGRTAALSTQLSHVQSVLLRALRPKDRFSLFVSGKDSVKRTTLWKGGDSATIVQTLTSFAGSSYAATLDTANKPIIIFCDQSAVDLWSFTGIDSIAYVLKYSDIVNASAGFAGATIVASYRHGFESSGTTIQNLSLILPRIDSLLMGGGRFLGFYDYNRNGPEKILTHYLQAFATNANHSSSGQVLIRTDSGYISSAFPPTMTVNVANYFIYNDPDIRKELTNVAGNPAVVSKHVFNGLVVASGLYSFFDDGALKNNLSVAMLGLNPAGSPAKGTTQQLRSLCLALQQSALKDTAKEIYLFSNADSVIAAGDVQSWVGKYVSDFGSTHPTFRTVNLLDGYPLAPASLVVDGVEYYGSGYLLNSLATATRGVHFETHVRDWFYIAGALTYSPYDTMDSLHVAVAPSAGGAVLETEEIAPEPQNTWRPRFFTGLASGSTALEYTVTAHFVQMGQTLIRTATSSANIDTSRSMPVLATMLGWEKLQQLFKSSQLDTGAIVRTAVAFNLLCDYTAMICLEPDSIHNPNTGHTGSTAVKDDRTRQSDSLTCSAYPNPFNGQTTLSVNVVHESDVSFTIFNMLGQEVRHFVWAGARGAVTGIWDGTNDQRLAVSSGFYIVRIDVKNVHTGVIEVRTIKLLLVR